MYTARSIRSARGFTLLELYMVMAIIAVLAAIAVGLTPGVIRAMKGESIAGQLNGFLRAAREDAIARRRLIRIVTTEPNRIDSFEVSPLDGTTAALRNTTLEGGLEFTQFDDQGDTGDDFGADEGPVQFGGDGPHQFTSDGMFVDANGDPVNGTIFIGQPGFPSTAAAVTVLGATAVINVWRWNGREWVQ